MSVELLPPDPEYPDAYHVRTNWCRCHPETCCCNDWAVHSPDGEKHSTYFHEETANEVAEALNMMRSNDQLERMRRVWAMPAADTFDIPPIGALVRKYLHGVSVDPFARNKRWATHTNDLNPCTLAEHHMQAPDFLRMLADHGVAADVVLFDPPYSPRQVAECYAAAGVPVTKTATQNAALYAACRREIRRLCRRGSLVLSFGWNTCGMGAGFGTEELLIVCHGAAHNDTLCMVERMHEEQMELRSNVGANLRAACGPSS